MRIVSLLLLLALGATISVAAPVTLIKDGKCNTAIFVSPEVMAQTTLNNNAPYLERTRVANQLRLRASVNDLAYNLEKISGATVPVYTRMPDANDKVIPILVGSYADKTFGPFTMKTDFKQGYRYVVSAKGVGLQGETDEAISYAVYEILDRLGCRWYVPGEMGEVIPSLKTIALEPVDLQAAPGTVTRSIWYADDAFRRRNRLGGFPFTAGHALEGYLTKEQLEAHPGWNAELGGKRALQKCDVGYRICWANPAVSDAVADAIIARLDKSYEPCLSISPGDGVSFCECAQCKALDAGDWDDSMAMPSITDRYINFCNRVAARVVTKYPEVKLGFLAYVQFTRPPKREKLHPALIPQLAPITYCRAHTLIDANCPSRQQIKFLLEGWGKAAGNLAMYEYNYHLAETSAPFPAIARNVVELPVQYANHVTMWTPETLPNFDNFLPGMTLGIRMAWNTTAKPQDILNEFYTKFYGSAATQMSAYWQCIDDAWTTVPEHAGCGFSYMKRFTPDRMAEARKRMDAAIAACKTPVESQRVKLADENLRQFELFMKIRREYFAGQYATLGSEADQWVKRNVELGDQYRANSTFTNVGWTPLTLSGSYFKGFYDQSYQDASRLARDFQLLTPAINTFSFAVDKEKIGEAQGWQKPAFDDKAWKKTDVAVDTWYALGLAGYYGSAWYRTTVKLPALPAGKKVYLWVGATDGACKVFVNGQSVSCVDAKGQPIADPDGFCSPFSYDITNAVKGNADNQISLLATRTFLNELGTGGLMGPVLVYREK